MTTHKLDLIFAKAIPAVIPTLTYREVPAKMRQPRLAGRSVLQPDIDLKLFECRAVIDRIVFAIKVKRPTQFRYVREVAKKSYEGSSLFVRARNDENLSTKVFDVTLQEPTVARLLAVIRDLEREFGFADPAEITLLEVSVDFRPRGPSDENRSRLVSVLQRAIFPISTLWTEPGSEPRFSYGSNPGEGSALFPCNKRRGAGGSVASDAHLDPTKGRVPPVDATMYLGKRSGPWLIRIMDKVIDRQNPALGTFETLHAEKRRVRVEVAISGDELYRLSLNDPNNLIGFKFNKLQGEYFRFMLPTTGTKPAVASASLRAVCSYVDAMHCEHFLRTGVVGLSYVNLTKAANMLRHIPLLRSHLRREGLSSKRRRRGTGVQNDFVAYAALNAMVQTALKHLTERETRSLVGKLKLNDE
jgi:hypothetical protein